MDRLDTVRSLMSSLFDIAADQISADARPSDIPEWDSVGHLNLMLALEDAFGVQLSIHDMSRLNSVSAILKHIEAMSPTE